MGGHVQRDQSAPEDPPCDDCAPGKESKVGNWGLVCSRHEDTRGNKGLRLQWRDIQSPTYSVGAYEEGARETAWHYKHCLWDKGEDKCEQHRRQCLPRARDLLFSDLHISLHIFET